METCLLSGALFRLTQARLGDVIPAHGHGVLPEGGGAPGGGRSVGRGFGSAHGRRDLAHGSVHHPSERLHRHVFLTWKTPQQRASRDSHRACANSQLRREADGRTMMNLCGCWQNIS